MIDGIPLANWTPLGALVAVLALPYFLIALGKLKPRRDLDDVIHDRDQWRAESRLRDQHIVELTEQNTILLREIAPTLNNGLAALRQTADESKVGDES